MFFLVGSLLWTYSVFPEMVAVDFSNTGAAELYVSKEHIFYLIMGLFLINNVLMARLIKLVPSMETKHMPIPNRLAWAQNRPLLNELVSNWLNALVGSINTILGLSLLSLATINSEQYNLSVFDFSWVLYLGLGFFTVLFLLPIRLIGTPVPEEKI